jgi:hypothetical protein
MVPLHVKWCCSDSVEYRARCQATGAMGLVPEQMAAGTVARDRVIQRVKESEILGHEGYGALLGPGRGHRAAAIDHDRLTLGNCCNYIA